MSNEIQISGIGTGLTNVFVCIQHPNGTVRDIVNDEWEIFALANLDDYDIATTEAGDSGTYIGSMPSGGHVCPAGRYLLVPYRGDPSVPEITEYLEGAVEIVWDGSAEETSALENTLTAIKGDGWTNETLKTIKEYVDSLEGNLALLGPGDHTVTLMIRTTSGVAIEGVAVWANTANDRSGAIAGTVITGDDGAITLFLDYGVKYYIFCHKAGYSFATADITPIEGSVTFTKDIGTAAVIPEDGYIDSFLTRGIAAVRRYVDEPAINVKYSDSQIIAELGRTYPIILGEINRNTQTPIVARIIITIVNNTYSYILPYTIGSVYAIYETNSMGAKAFYDSRGRYNPYGRFVWIEGNTLHIQEGAGITNGTQLTIEYIPSGAANLHNGICDVNNAGDEVTLSPSPNAGSLDTHENAYAGCILRILKITGDGATGDYLQERTIIEYNRTTRVAVLDVALDPVPSAGQDGYIYYEITPTIWSGIDEVIAAYSAYVILSIEGSIDRANAVLAIYRDKIRMVRLSAFYSLLQTASQLRGDNYGNKRYRRI